MKSLMTLLAFAGGLTFSAASVQAATKLVKLDDPSILGEYTLAKADKKSDVQKVEVRFNADNKLIAWIDRNDTEFELDGPKADGTVYDGADEPNCDGDESRCLYDSRTWIKLENVKQTDGSLVPQLSVSITETNAFDDTGKDETTTTYVLNWSKALENAIPFFTNAEIPKDLAAVLKECKDTVEPTLGLGGLSNVGDICTIVSNYNFRDGFKEAFPWFLKAEGGLALKSQKITAEDLQTEVFAAAEKTLDAYDSKKLKVTKTELRKQMRAVYAYILSNDYFYQHRFAYMTVVYAVNFKNKTITSFMIRDQR